MTDKQYILLRETFGSGLEAFDGLNLEILNQDQLAEVVINQADNILGEECYESVHDYEKDVIKIEDNFVIFEMTDKIGDSDVNQWVRHLIVENKINHSKNEYELYLRLKQKYEN